MKNPLEPYGITEQQLRSLLISRRKPKTEVIKTHITRSELKVGVVSDTHFCSIQEKTRELHTIYEIFRKEGVQHVLHAGDIVAGQGIYKGQEAEIHTWGVDNQVRYCAEHYPNIKGIVTHFITGNHDLSFMKIAGADMGEMLARLRPDMTYLGQYAADIEINGVKFRLVHPDGAIPYALSYRGQKIAEQIPSGQKPKVLLLGHLHVAFYYWYRNMHVLQCGCFEGQTSYLLRKGLNPAVGGWLLKLKLSEKNEVLGFVPTFIPFF